MRNKKFFNIFLLYTTYIWFIVFGGAILPTHFLAEGLSFQQMIVGRVLSLGAQILMLIGAAYFSARRAWQWSAIFSLLYLLLVVKIESTAQFYIAGIFSGLATVLFFIFYNIAHFESTPKDKRGLSSSIMFALPPLIQFVAPLAAGFVATYNMNLLWILVVCFFILPIMTSRLPESFRATYNLKKAWQEIKATRWFIFLGGVWEALSMGIVPVYTLFFIKEPLPYGAYLAYLSLLAILANVSLGRLTDRIQKRAVFLYPVTIILALITLLFSVSTQDLTLWMIASGGLYFMMPLFWNVSTAVVVDAHPNLRLAIPGREFSLIVGRLIGMLMVLISFMVEPTPRIIFFVLTGVMALYPVLLFWNTKVSKKYQYL